MRAPACLNASSFVAANRSAVLSTSSGRSGYCRSEGCTVPSAYRNRSGCAPNRRHSVEAPTTCVGAVQVAQHYLHARPERLQRRRLHVRRRAAVKCASWYHPSSWNHRITATYASPKMSSRLLGASGRQCGALARYSKNESHPAPIPPLRLIQRPVLTLMVFPSRSRSDRRDHSALIARFEARSNRQSPVMRDRAPNSSAYEPTAATLVSAVSP